MTVSELGSALGYECIQEHFEDVRLRDGYTSDLLSDVMANAPEDSVLITIQAHKNTVAVATLAGIRAVVVCNSRPVPDDMIDAARAESLAVFRTEKNQFRVTTEIAAALDSDG
ncbi:MAG: hypothetical protein ACLFUM_00865 [Spirochaetaceae bacterium]